MSRCILSKGQDKQIVRSGRRITLPKQCGINEGDVVIVEIVGNKIIITPTIVTKNETVDQM